MSRHLAPWLLALAAASAAAQPLPPITVHAAGSLRAALTDVARAYEAQHPGQGITLTFGPSGLLKDRIAGGEAAQVFASANMTHPQALHAQGKAEPVRAFARNALCALAAPGFSLQGKPLPRRLLDADVRVATSTPKADPAGDYAFEMFERVESSGSAAAGATAALKAKALLLTGGPSSPQPQPGRSLYGQLMAEGRADVFITYCTNAAEARREVPALQVLPVPEAVTVAARYGVTLVTPATDGARRFLDFLLSPPAQALLAAQGFSSP